MTQTADSYTHAIIESNGVKLHVVQAGPTDGTLVILLHGFPDFWYGWKAQIDALAAAGYRVWAPDQRGYNLSDKPLDVSAYHLDQLSADVIGLIEAAGQEKALIAGHDWGGNVAWWLTIFHPERVEKLVICNVGHPLVFRELLDHSWKQKLRSWYLLFFQLRGLPEALLARNDYQRAWASMASSGKSFTEEDRKYHVAAWSQPRAFTSMLNWYRAVRPLPEQPRDQWRVRVPTLVIWGRQDTFLGAGLADDSIKLCDQGRVEFIDEATHWVMHDEPARVSSLMLDFFKA